MKAIEYLKQRGIDLINPQEMSFEKGLEIVKSLFVEEQDKFYNEYQKLKCVEIRQIEENETFDCYTYGKIRSDSTLIFDLENISSTLSKILLGYTYPKNKYTPNDILTAKNLIYSIDNIIINSYIDENINDFRKYIHEVFIPYKLEIQNEEFE